MRCHHYIKSTGRFYNVTNAQVPRTTASTRHANCCQPIPPNDFLDGFPDLNQFAAAKMTHYSSKRKRPSYSSRPRQLLLLSGDVDPGHTTNVRYVLAMSQVVGFVICAIVVLTGYILSVLVFQTQRSTAEVRTACSSFSPPPILPTPQPLPPSIPT